MVDKFTAVRRNGLGQAIGVITGAGMLSVDRSLLVLLGIA